MIEALPENVGNGLVLSHKASLADCAKAIQKQGVNVVFLVDAEGCLLGSVGDGDLRRALASGADHNSIASRYANEKPVYHSPNSSLDLDTLFRIQEIHYIPVVDEKNRILHVAERGTRKRYPLSAPLLAGNELEYVAHAIRGNWISSRGEYVETLAGQFESLLRDRHCMSVGSGTAALHLALLGLGIGEGDEVIVPNITFGATANAVIHCGAIPRFADISVETWNITTEQLLPLLNPSTRAVLCVHLYGNPCDLTELNRFCKSNDLLLIEDAAEAVGSYYKGDHVGSHSDASIFSFFGNKTITTGEGGMVAFRCANALETARVYANHGVEKLGSYWHQVPGFNYRMSNLQAAVGVGQMEQLQDKIDEKKRIADYYIKNLDERMQRQLWHDESDVCTWLNTFLLPVGCKRDEVIGELQKKDIDARKAFPALSRMPAFQSALSTQLHQNFVQSVSVADRGLSLPSGIGLEEPVLMKICERVHQAIEFALS